MGGSILFVILKAMSLELFENFLLIFLKMFTVKRKATFREVFVRGHVYEFFSKVVCDFLKLPLFDFDYFEKEYDIDMVATKLLGIETKWPAKKVLKVFDLTLKYVGLHKVAMTNWWPTTHFPTVFEDFSCFLYDVGTGVKVNLCQIMFEFITDHKNGKKPGQRFPFPSLIYGALSTQN